MNARVPTSMRQGTAARMTTAQRQANFSGVGQNAKVTAVERPVTSAAHGLAGVQASGKLGQSRQIIDGKYHLVELKKKNQLIRDEIGKLTNEVEEINKDNQTYLTLERKWDTLIKEVRGLEGELADRNLAQDKQRSGTKPEDIDAHFFHIKNQNDR